MIPPDPSEPLMTAEAQLAFVLRVLAAVAFDHNDDLWWRTDGEYAPVTFYITCNDVFAWGSADLERVTPENVGLLEQSITDCQNAFDGTSIHHGGGTVDHLVCGPMLFCARSRGIRPQGAVLKDIKNPKVLALFDAVGPKRDIDIGNPYAHPSDGGNYEFKKEAHV